MFFVALILGSLSYAGVTSSSTLSALSNAWKSGHTTKLQPGHDINIVYGGEDVAHKIDIDAPLVTA